MLGAQPRPPPPPPQDGGAAPQQQQDGGAAAVTEPAFYEVEYFHQICRGITIEQSGGRRRCASASGDRDLQVVSRHYLAAFAVRGGEVFCARASAPAEAWDGAAGLLLESVRSFGLPA